MSNVRCQSMCKLQFISIQVSAHILKYSHDASFCQSLLEESLSHSELLVSVVFVIRKRLIGLISAGRPGCPAQDSNCCSLSLSISITGNWGYSPGQTGSLSLSASQTAECY